jgi:type IV secretory pathway VirB10-like protein
MRRRASALRWILAGAAAVAVAAFVNVVLLRATEENDEPVGRLRPLLVGVTTQTGADGTPPATTDRPAETQPATPIQTAPATTAETPTITDDHGGGSDDEPDDDSSGRGGGDDDSSGHGGGGDDDDD